MVVRYRDLASLVYYAYDINPAFQISSKDNSLLEGDSYYDIEARTKDVASDQQLRLMLQTLLEERFQLSVHKEPRTVVGYDLVVVKEGRLKGTRTDVRIAHFGVPVAEGTAGAGGMPDGMHLMGKAAPTSVLAEALSSQMLAPVRDVTGISGRYDFDLRFEGRYGRFRGQPENPPPSLEKAIEEELGLKLIKGKVSVEFLVVDHMGKLTPN